MHRLWECERVSLTTVGLTDSIAMDISAHGLTKPSSSHPEIINRSFFISTVSFSDIE